MSSEEDKELALLKLQKLIKECERETVVIWRQAKNEAKVFNLYSKEEIYKFIANNGLKDLEYRNTALLRLYAARQTPAPLVYTFKFRSRSIPGYIAFFKDENELWTIKSLKRDTERPASLLPGLENILK